MIAPDIFARRIRAELATGLAPTDPSVAESTPPSAATGSGAVDPGHSEEKVVENTGHTWAEWVDLIDAGPGRAAGHTAIAAWVHAEHALTGWWAQGVTVGYERLAGLRLPGQMADGTFSVSRSRVLALSADLLRSALLDEHARADLFPDVDTVLRSAPAAKTLRFAVSAAGHPAGSLQVAAEPVPAGRLRVTVTHEKLPTFDAANRWKPVWADWLAAVAVAAADLTAADQGDNRARVATASAKSSGLARE
jgi:hypothetical protein